MHGGLQSKNMIVACDGKIFKQICSFSFMSSGLCNFLKHHSLSKIHHSLSHRLIHKHQRLISHRLISHRLIKHHSLSNTTAYQTPQLISYITQAFKTPQLIKDTPQLITCAYTILYLLLLKYSMNHQFIAQQQFGEGDKDIFQRITFCRRYNT